MNEEKLDAFETKRNEIKAYRSIPYEKKESKYDAKNYLNTKLGDKELEKEFQIRVLPLTNDSEDIFEEVYFHWDAKAKKSFVCAKHTKNTPEGTNKECQIHQGHIQITNTQTQRYVVVDGNSSNRRNGEPNAG